MHKHCKHSPEDHENLGWRCSLWPVGGPCCEGNYWNGKQWLTVLGYVQSNYRAPWKGVILKREKRTTGGRFGRIGDLLTISVIIDRHGNRMRKRYVRTLDESWTTLIEPFDISWVPKEWFTLSP